jgi:tetratricopeptide (TPR) repeat protein
VLSQVKRGDYAPPNSVATDVSHSLQAICQKAMNLLPDKRYQSVSEMTLDIERWLADEPVSAYQDTTVERLSRWIRKNLARVYAGTGIAAVSTVLAFGIVITNGAKRRAVDAEKFTSILESVISDEFGQFFHVESDTKEGDSLAAIAQKFPGDESQQLRMHVTFGNLMLDREDYDASAEHFRAAKELLPKSDVNPKYEWDAINGSAIVRWRRGEADAIAIVERLREMAAFDPDNSKLRRLDLLEANALKNSSDELELGDRLAAYEKASKLYQKYLTAESEPVDSSLFNLAQLHVERALAYRDAAKKRIASTLATEELEALAKEALTDGCEALQEMIRRIQERGAGNPTTLPKVWAEYAKTLHRLGDYAAADDAYNTACGMLSSELGDKHRIAIQTAYSWMVLLNQFMPAVDLPDKLERQKRGARFFVDNYIEGNGKPDSILTQNGIGLLARVAPDEFAKEFKQWVELDRKIKDGDFVAILSAVAP